MRRCVPARDVSGNQGISRLVNPVVEKGVGLVLPKHQARPHGLPQGGVDLVDGALEDHAERGDIRNVAERGKPLQGVLGRRGQAGELCHHQVPHVVGIALGADALQIPDPAPGVGVEGEQLLLGQGGQELDGEERIAAGLVVNQVRQGSRRLW